MTTSQVALKGLERCLDFTEMQRDSQSSFYSTGIESLQQIRELAAQICIAANDALAKVGLDEPQSIVKPSKSLGLDDIEECVNHATEQAVLNIFNQLNIVNQQNISIDISTNENIVNTKIDEDKFEDLEPIDIEIPVQSELSQKDDKPSSQFMSDFKQVLHKVAAHLKVAAAVEIAVMIIEKVMQSFIINNGINLHNLCVIPACTPIL